MGPRVVRRLVLLAVLSAVATFARLDGGVALAAPGDAVCIVTPSPLSNVIPSRVVLSSPADDEESPLSAQLDGELGLLIRDPGADNTALEYGRWLPPASIEAASDGSGDLTFRMPAANIAGEFEVVTENRLETSDCVSGVSGIFDGLSIGQERRLIGVAGSEDTFDISVRGTAAGEPLDDSTLVTISTSVGEFVAVNGQEITPSHVAQMRLNQGVVEGSSTGTLTWRAGAESKPKAGTITATAFAGEQPLLKSVTASIAPAPTLASTTFSGILPEPGDVGLLVAATDVTAADLMLGLTDAGCFAGTIALLDEGAWNVYIPGAPASVNDLFPETLRAGTPFFLRCVAQTPTP
ncbi:MAG: hypothetical protein R3C39_04145 [Dehalococcoidia bacterium]